MEMIDVPVYLVTVLELGSRRCVGWKCSAPMEVVLVLRALHVARETGRPAPRLIHHSDGEWHERSRD